MDNQLSNLQRFAFSGLASLLGYLVSSAIYLSYRALFAQGVESFELLGSDMALLLAAVIVCIGWLAVFVPIVLCLKQDNRLFTRGVAPIFAAFSSLCVYLVLLLWAIDFRLTFYGIAHVLTIGLVAGFVYSRLGKFPESTKKESVISLGLLLFLLVVLAGLSLVSTPDLALDEKQEIKAPVKKELAFIFLQFQEADETLGVYNWEGEEQRRLFLPTEQLLLQKALPKGNLFTGQKQRVTPQDQQVEVATNIVVLKSRFEGNLQLPVSATESVLLVQTDLGFNYLPIDAPVADHGYHLKAELLEDGATKILLCQGRACQPGIQIPAKKEASVAN